MADARTPLLVHQTPPDATPTVYGAAGSVEPSTVPEGHGDASAARRPALKRFFCAAAAGVTLILVLVALLWPLGVITYVWVIRRLAEPTEPEHWDGVVQSCHQGGRGAGLDMQADMDADRRTSRVQLELDDAPNASFYLFTRGNTAGGKVNVSFTESDIPGVAVSVDYDHRGWASRWPWKVCRLDRDGAQGLGVYFPQYTNYDARLDGYHWFNVAIDVLLPAATTRQFNGSTEYYNHYLRLAEEPALESLKLWSTHGDVHVEGTASADDIEVTFWEGSIFGSFNATRRLALRTSNGPITSPSLTLGSRVNPQEPSDRTPWLSIQSFNAPISVSDISFLTPASSANTSAFFAYAQTFNTPVDLRVSHLPMGSHLRLDVLTSNANSSVVIPSTYEGSILQRTSRGETSALLVQENMPDPRGQGREYHVTTYERGGGDREDMVGWDSVLPSPGPGGSRVYLRTSGSGAATRVEVRSAE